VASYFAAGDLPPEPEIESLAIWAFSTTHEHTWRGFLQPFNRLPQHSIEAVTAPYASNPNLRAQEGLHLTIPATKEQWLAPALRLDFAGSLEAVQEFHAGKDVLLKFIMPTAAAPRLLRYLAKEGVTASRLFPGYDGVARAIKEEWLQRSQ
jgi:hypothetical protein